MTRGDRNLIVWSIVAAIALFAVFVVRDDATPDDWRRAQYGGRVELYEAASAWIASRDTVNRARAEWVRVDSRERVPRGVRPDAKGLILQSDASLNASIREGVRASVYAELERAGVEVAAHPIAVVTIIDTIMNQYGNAYMRVNVLPRRADEPCTVVVRIARPSRQWSRRPERERLLGPCGFFAKYGAAGTGMYQYLHANTMQTAQYTTSPTPWIDQDRLYSNSFARGWPALAACRAGRASGCLEVFQGRSPVAGFFGMSDPGPSSAGNDVMVDGPLNRSWFFERFSAGLLAELATSMGQERFTRLWRDDRGPVAAYEAIVGEPVTAWTGRVVAANVEPYRPGPGVPLMPVAATMLVLGGASVAALRGTRRRMT